MSFDGINVEHGKLDQGSADVMAAAKDIQARLDTLEDELKPLASDWTGAAKEAYREAKATWDKAIADMIVLLEQASANVRHVQPRSTRPPTRAAPTASDPHHDQAGLQAGRPSGRPALVCPGRVHRAACRPYSLLPIGDAGHSRRPGVVHGRTTKHTGDHSMSQTTPVGSGLVRVTVASGSRRVDLVLPGAVPVAELVPELARSVGILDASTVYGGYRLIAQDGRQLANDAGLLIQGIEDGGLLTVTAGIDDEAPRVYDDIVEAMADVVEHELKPVGSRPPDGVRRWAPPRLLLGLGALALLLQGESMLGGLAAAAVAGLLVVGGIVLARGQDEPEAGVAVALIAVLYAGVAGLLLAPGELGSWSWPLPTEFFGAPLAAAGGAMLLVGVVAVRRASARGARCVIPAIVVGAILGACGLLMQVTEFEPERRVHGGDDARRAGRQHLPVAGAGRHRDEGRPDLLAARHHRRPRRDRPRPGGRRRPRGARDPARRVGDRRHPARAAGSARREPRRLRHHPGGGVLPGRHVPHPPVPRRLRGPRRPGLRHRSAWSRSRCRCC